MGMDLKGDMKGALKIYLISKSKKHGQAVLFYLTI